MNEKQSSVKPATVWTTQNKYIQSNELALVLFVCRLWKTRNVIYTHSHCLNKQIIRSRNIYIEALSVCIEFVLILSSNCTRQPTVITTHEQHQCDVYCNEYIFSSDRIGTIYRLHSQHWNSKISRLYCIHNTLYNAHISHYDVSKVPYFQHE